MRKIKFNNCRVKLTYDQFEIDAMFKDYVGVAPSFKIISVCGAKMVKANHNTTKPGRSDNSNRDATVTSTPNDSASTPSDSIILINDDGSYVDISGTGIKKEAWEMDDEISLIQYDVNCLTGTVKQRTSTVTSSNRPQVDVCATTSRKATGIISKRPRRSQNNIQRTSQSSRDKVQGNQSVAQKRFKCDRCNYTSNFKQALKKHASRKHNVSM